MASEKDEAALVVEVDLDKNRAVQEGWGFLRNRRPETYNVLIEPIRAGQCLPVECSMPLGKLCKGESCSGATPASMGYHMPAEWERHDAVWLSWPYDLDSFPEIDNVERAFLSIIKAVSDSEVVNLLVKDDLVKLNVADMLKKSGADIRRVNFHFADYADVWFRDYGPTFVVNRAEGRLAMVDWTFNAWGEKYPELMGDDRIPCVVNEDLGLKCFQPGIVMEGGSIEVNGQGTVITTEQCLLNQNRNPGLSREDIECYLRSYLGVRKVIWLKEGIVGDDTDGHVDDIARFVDPITVLCAFEEDEGDENYDLLKENYDILSRSTDQDGRALKVIKLPMPGRVGGDKRLPASYANFYIGNSTVLAPIFGHQNDDLALKIIGQAFPGRNVVGIRCEDVVHGLGTIHCVTQQQPSV
jgi:agmatine deiminase